MTGVPFRLIVGVAGACAIGVSLGVGGQAQGASVEAQTVVSRQVAVMRQQCLQNSRDATLADIRARDERQQRQWCDATRDARREELGAAFVESVRRAKDGGNGLAKTIAEFLRKTPEAIKPLAVNTAACADEKLRIDDALLEPLVDHPSIVGSIFGVNLNGKRVSRLNPVPRWERLLKEGIVLRSPQMAYTVPFPMTIEAEKTATVQRSQTAACPSTAELDRALAAHSEESIVAPEAATTEREAVAFVAAMLADSYQRQHLGPLVQLAQASARLPGLSAACDRDLRVLLSDEELARRIAIEFVKVVGPGSLQRVRDVRRTLGDAPMFSSDGQLHLFHPENEREQARILEVYGNDSRARFMVDASDVTVAATQAMALGLYGWSSARSDLIAKGCLPGRP